MRPPGAVVFPPRLVGSKTSPHEIATVRALGVRDIKAMLRLGRPTRVRLVVFHPVRFGEITGVRHFHRREEAIAAAERISGLPTAVVVDGPDPADARFMEACLGRRL